MKNNRTSATNGRNAMGFAGLAKTIAAKWGSLDATEKIFFQNQAHLEKERYKKEIEIWKLKHESKDKGANTNDDARGKHYGNQTSTTEPSPTLSTQPTLEDMVQQTFVNDLAFIMDSDAETQSFNRLVSQLDTDDCEFLISSLKQLECVAMWINFDHPETTTFRHGCELSGHEHMRSSTFLGNTQ